MYINGKLAAEHKGGFLPFEVEITDLIPAGTRGILTVAADNRIHHGTLPVGNEGAIAFFGSDNPGVPSVEAAKRWAKPQNIPNFDFFNYAGINRPVRLYTTPEIYIDDITLVPSVEGADGLVEYAVSVKGGERENLISEMTVIEILDENRNCVARGTGDAGVFGFLRQSCGGRGPERRICIQPGFPVGKMCMNRCLASAQSG